jgi:hypothetical protein
MCWWVSTFRPKISHNLGLTRTSKWVGLNLPWISQVVQGLGRMRMFWSFGSYIVCTNWLPASLTGCSFREQRPLLVHNPTHYARHVSLLLQSFTFIAPYISEKARDWWQKLINWVAEGIGFLEKTLDSHWVLIVRFVFFFPPLTTISAQSIFLRKKIDDAQTQIFGSCVMNVLFWVYNGHLYMA